MVNRRSRNLTYASIPAMMLAYIAPFAADAQSPHITLALTSEGTPAQIQADAAVRRACRRGGE